MVGVAHFDSIILSQYGSLLEYHSHSKLAHFGFISFDIAIFLSLKLWADDFLSKG